MTRVTTFAIDVAAMRTMPFAASVDREPERLGDLAPQRARAPSGVELHLAAEEAVGRQPPEHEVRVGHRRLVPPSA